MTEAEEKIQAAEQDLKETVSELKTTTAAEKTSGWTPELVGKLSLGIGTFAVVSFIIVAFLIWKNKRSEQILRTFGILVIIFAAVFLVVAGYSQHQITPAIGLLGTIAGYLLGRRIEETKDSKHDSEQR